MTRNLRTLENRGRNVGTGSSAYGPAYSQTAHNAALSPARSLSRASPQPSKADSTFVATVMRSELLDKAARYAHVSVSEFVLSHALASAELVVQANECITLKPADFQAFLAALDAPATIDPALEKAFQRHAAQVSR